VFIGAINSTLRQYLVSIRDVFDGARVIVGCSGNFTSEATLTQYAKPLEIHSNDVSFYSALVGGWLTEQPLNFEVSNEYAWLRNYMDTPTKQVASIMVLLDMLPYEKRNNPHSARMWDIYHNEFGNIVEETSDKLVKANIHVASFYAGDVFDHFRRFENDEKCIYCCYAPTYKGGYERMYRRLDEIVEWNEPTYPMLDDQRRDELLEWMSKRQYLWYDDRLLEKYAPILKQRRGLQRTVYLYSNIASSALFAGFGKGELPRWKLAQSDFEIDSNTNIVACRIKTSELEQFKEAFLSKEIDFAHGTWAFAVYANETIVGFFEFDPPKVYRAIDELYLMSDFPVPNTQYARLSKLISMLAVCGETRGTMERIRERRVRTVLTTAFTERAVSMKYRGVMKLVKRGQTEDGHKFLNYATAFNDQSYKEVLNKWLIKHSSKRQ